MLAFVDTETTSLLPAFHPQGRRVWEAAIGLRDGAGDRGTVVVYVDVDLTYADPAALAVGGYYDRHPAVTGVIPLDDDALVYSFTDPAAAGALIGALLAGCTVVGANPGFDTEGLAWLVGQCDGLSQAEPWHYRPYCVTTVGGTLAGMTPPFHSETVAAWLGVDRAGFTPAHTAYADMAWARAQYDAIQERTRRAR